MCVHLACARRLPPLLLPVAPCSSSYSARFSFKALEALFIDLRAIIYGCVSGVEGRCYRRYSAAGRGEYGGSRRRRLTGILCERSRDQDLVSASSFSLWIGRTITDGLIQLHSFSDLFVLTVGANWFIDSITCKFDALHSAGSFTVRKEFCFTGKLNRKRVFVITDLWIRDVLRLHF